MPLLAGLFVTLFGNIAAWFGAWLTKKAALGAAAVTTFGILTGAFYGAMSLLIAGLVTTFPAVEHQALLWVALPDNVALFVAATIGADTAVALYRWNVENLRLTAYIT